LQKGRKMERKRRLALMWKWSLLTGGLIALFWLIWYFVAGSVPVFQSVKIAPELTLDLPFGISRWWDVLMGPLWSVVLIFLLTGNFFSPQEDDKEDLVFGLVSGLAFGLVSGLAFGLVSGLAFGLGFGMVSGLAFGLGFGLVAGLAIWLSFGIDFGLGFGLGFGLVHGLAFGLGFGLGLGLGFGLVAELIIGIIFALEWLFSPKKRDGTANWL
jgi:hypothetical protein